MIEIENHIASVALHFMHYNFCRVHQTLRVTPAMEAVASPVWSLEELVGLLDAADKKAAYHSAEQNAAQDVG